MHQFYNAFLELKLKPDDFIISGRRDKSGAPMPISTDNLAIRVRAVTATTGKKYPHLKDALGSISPYKRKSVVADEILPPSPPESPE